MSLTTEQAIKILTEAKDVKDTLDSAGVKYSVAAEKCGVSKTNFSRYLNGKFILNQEQLARINQYVTKVKQFS